MKTWTPHDYQKRAIKLLLSQAAAGLFLDPGLGKTSTVLAAFKILKEKGLVKRMLVVAPLRPVYSVWPAEIRKWDNFENLTCSVLHGKEKGERLLEDTDVHIINPEGLEWFFNTANLENYDILCIDESTKFKNSQSKRFKLLKKKLQHFPRRWILTGTPTPKGIIDLFSQIYILDYGRSLGAYITHFRNMYMNQPDPRQPYLWVPNEQSMEEITEKIAPLILRLNAEDYLSMPPLITNDIIVELDDKIMMHYEAVQKDFVEAVDAGIIVAAGAAAAGMKCRQIANGAVYLEESSNEYADLHDHKVDALEELIEELNGKPILLSYEFKHDLYKIRKRFGDVPSLSEMPASKADITIARFNAGEIPILTGHPASMGHGLNMQEACHNVVFYGLTWDLELYDQLIKRVWRQGQKHPVTLHRIIAKGTLDETVASVLAQKDKTQRSILKAISDRRSIDESSTV